MNAPETKPEDTTVTASTVTPGIVNAGPSPEPVKAEELPVGTAGRPIKLKYPFKNGDKIVHEVSFLRRPKAGDLIMHFGAATAAEQELCGIAILLGVVPEDLKEMDGADYLVVQKEWAAFLGV